MEQRKKIKNTAKLLNGKLQRNVKKKKGSFHLDQSRLKDSQEVPFKNVAKLWMRLLKNQKVKELIIHKLVPGNDILIIIFNGFLRKMDLLRSKFRNVVDNFCGKPWTWKKHKRNYVQKTRVTKINNLIVNTHGSITLSK